MNEQGVLLLVGAEALQLKDRLEASGYTALEWGPGDRTIAASGQSPMAAIVSPGQMLEVSELRQWFGTLPILLGVSEDNIHARELCLSSGADDFWLDRFDHHRVSNAKLQALGLPSPKLDHAVRISHRPKALAGQSWTSGHLGLNRNHLALMHKHHVERGNRIQHPKAQRTCRFKRKPHSPQRWQGRALHQSKPLLLGLVRHF